MDSRYRKHLTLQDRYTIEEGLNHGYTLTRIAEEVGKDKTTISKEIRKHRIGNSQQIGKTNDCMNRFQCPIQHLCKDCLMDRDCCKCRKEDCRKICPEYRSDSCRYTHRAPYVCNGCSMVYDCHRPHFYYRATSAYSSYVEQLKSSREGIMLSKEQLFELDCLLTPLLKQGQSIAHIYAMHKQEIPCSMKTLYNYIDMGIFTARNIDLPKKVKYKKRKNRRKEPETDYAYREGRTYKDFLEYISANGETPVVELDTVHGSKATGRVMMTMLFRSSTLMLIFLLPDCTQKSVRAVFDRLTDSLGLEEFRKCFPVILTDNGSEFKDPVSLEKTEGGQTRTRIFYCDPLASWQKARLEKNHEFIRRVIPKGQPLDSYTQEDMTLLANHINSTARSSLNNRTPYELAEFINSEKLLKTQSLERIDPDRVILTPQLFKHR